MFIDIYVKIRKLEAWMSGLNQRFTKPSYFNRYREFESHRLRQMSKLEP
jgi:hypothetical protein